MVNVDTLTDKIPTGIEGFEHITYGGLTTGKTSLVVGTSGTGKTMFAMEVLSKGVTIFNRPVVFVTLEEPSDDIKNNALKMGWDLDRYVTDKMLKVIDASPDPVPLEKTGDYDLSGLLTQIAHSVKEIKAEVVIMDSIGSLFYQFRDVGLIRREIFRIVATLKDLGVTTILTAERTQEYGPVSKHGVEEFITDNVIILRNVLEEEKCRRTIQILKMRGALHSKGEFPFTMSRTGIHIIPLSAAELKQTSSNIRVSSGNNDLDEMTGGGFFRDAIVLVSGPTGSGKTLMSATFTGAACENKEKVLLLAYEESREQLLRNAMSWGENFQNYENEELMKIICVYPEAMGLEDHLLMIRTEIEKFKPDRLVIDSVSALERIATVKNFREFVIGLTSFVKEENICSLLTSTTPRLSGGDSVTEQHISTITDIIILLRYVEINGVLRRGISVIKMRGSQHDKQIREFSIDTGGLHIAEPFKNIQNIVLGIPSQSAPSESEQLGEMFKK